MAMEISNNADKCVTDEIILISSESEEESSTNKSSELPQEKCGSSKENKNPLLNHIKCAQDSTSISHVDVNGKTNSLNSQPCHKPEQCADIDGLFEKFVAVCVPLIKENKDSTEIIKLIKSRHSRSTSDFKSSNRYRNLLNRSIKKLSNGCKQEFVYINEVATVLSQHTDRKKRRVTTTKGDNGTANGKKLKTETSSEKNDTEDSDIATTSLASEQASDRLSEPLNKEIQAKINHYESLLKRSRLSQTPSSKLLPILKANFSDEIKRLQAHEMSLEEMENEDSTYIQEAKLKRKAMLIFEKLCSIKKVPPKTGRVSERKISLSASRYPEINKKVESYVNRVRKFPDFYDIKYLVKRASEKHKLGLERQEIETISKSLFQEVGKRLQRVRHSDFVLNFGSYLTDVAIETKQPDPAEQNPELLSKLQANRVKAKSALEEVINKFAEKQEESKDAEQSAPKDLSEEGSNLESDPPSEASSENESDPSISEDDVDENVEEGIDVAE